MATKRGPGRPRKIQNVEEIKVVTKEEVIDEGNGLGLVTQELLPVKHVLRAISQQGITDPDGQYFSVDVVEARLAEYYDQGYKLFDTHYVGNVPEGNSIVVLYILVLA